MSENTSTYNGDWLTDVRRAYLAGADGKLSELEHAITALEMNPGSHSHERKLRRLLHNLIGSGGSYGFPAVSDTARAMSDCLHRRLNEQMPVNQQTVTDLRAQLKRLRAIFSEARV